MNNLNLNELYELERRRRDLEHRAHIARLMASVPCPECGSTDGMIDWHRDAIGHVEPHELWFSYPTMPNVLYSPCWQCNPTCAVAAGYTALTFAQAAAWLRPAKGEDHAH